MRLASAAASFLLAGLVGAPAAGAAWSAPQQVGAAARSIGSPGLVAVPEGQAVVSWVRWEPGLPVPAGGLGRMDAGGAWHGVQALKAGIVAPPVALGGGEIIAALTSTPVGTGPVPARVRLALSTGTAGGGLTRSRTLTTAALASQSAPVLVTDGRAGLLAAWVERRQTGAGSTTYVLRAYRVGQDGWRTGFKGTGQTLSRTTAFDTDHGGQVAAALARDGRALVAFAGTRFGKRPLRTIDGYLARRGKRFGTRQVFGPQEGSARLVAAFGQNGRGVVAWGTQDGGEEANKPWVVRASTILAGSLVPGKPQVLDPGVGLDRPLGRIAAAADTDGRLAVLWSSIAKDRTYPVRVAQAAGDAARFGAPRQLAPDGVVGDLAFGPDHALLATWNTTAGYESGPPAQAFAAIQPAGGAFGAPEALGTAGGTRYDAAPRVAYVRGGAAIAAWPAKLEDGRSVLRVARREP